MEFKTLYQRLKPEVKTKLVESAGKYPATVGPLLKTLKDECCYLNLTYGDLLTLFGHGTDNQVPHLSDVSNLFEVS